MCYIVQGDGLLEVYSESEVEEDIDMPYDELASFCQELLKKYDLLKIKNEIHVLKKRIDCLSSNLSNCAFNHNRLESIFHKKEVSHMHANTPLHTHGHHAHTLHLYARVNKCIHCGRKGYLARICFDRINSINFINKNFGFLMMLTPVDPKENGYQNPHLMCLM